MKHKEKFVSLKNKLIRFCLGMVVVLLIFSVYVYLSGQRTLTKNQKMVDLYKSAYNYYMELDYIDRTLYQYAHTPSQELKRSIEEHSGLLINNAVVLNQGLNDPIVQDQLEIAHSYVAVITTFLENANGIPMSEMLRQYNEIHHLKTLIVRLYVTFEMSIEKARAENELQIKVQNSLQRKIFILLLILFGTLCIFFTKRFSQKLLGPILHLTEITTTAWDGPDYLAPQIECLQPYRQDEAQILTKSFYRMLERLDKQMEELQEKARLEQQLRIEEEKRAKIQKELNNTQLRMLQSQVNPHFLFNAMNSSAELAFIEGAERTEHLLKQIAVYLRYALSKVDKIVTVEEEKRSIEAYINIQRMRFGKRIDFSFDFSEECLDKNIPAMILQPLLENAIIHGVGIMCEGGKINIAAGLENGLISISVSDNGQGLAKEKLEELNKILTYRLENSDTQGIGLMNIYSRLQLFSENQASCTICSEPYRKTCFTLKFPSKNK